MFRKILNSRIGSKGYSSILRYGIRGTCQRFVDYTLLIYW